MIMGVKYNADTATMPMQNLFVHFSIFSKRFDQPTLVVTYLNRLISPVADGIDSCSLISR